MRRFPIKLTLLFVLVAAVAPFGYAATTTTPFTLPAKTQKTQVKCTACTGAAKDLLSVGYQGAVSTFAGRFLDSTYVGDWQGPVRTLRAWQMKYNQAHDRIYMRLGSEFVAYDGAGFISRLLSGQRLLDADMTYRPAGATAEKYLNPDRLFYPENESTWNQGRPDGQDYMPDFDYDDRGYVYLACRVLWGIIKDDYGKGGGGASLQAITQVLDASDSPGSIMSVKTADGRYFVIVGSGAGSSDIYDVSTPTAPTKTGKLSRGFAASSSVKTLDQHWIAVIEGTNLEIFTAEALVTNGSPSKTLVAPAGAYRGVTTDGTNFYSAIQSGATTIISMVTLSGGTWTEQQIPTGITFTPGSIHYGDGYLSIRGDSDIHVFRLNGAAVSDLDFSAYQGFAGAAPRYFPSFYSASFVPPGYLAPAQINFYDSLVYRYAGKSYLIANLKGLGDVYEIKGADSVSASLKGTSGTVNPNTPQPAGTGPYYGDKLVFNSTTTANAPFNVKWKFGNSESPDNEQTSTTGSDVFHQYSNIPFGGIGGARSVTVENSNDSSIIDTYLLTLASPAVRVGVKNTALLFTAPNASSPAPIVTSDQFVDASDGMVEGHYASWNLDGTITKALPTDPTSVGSCGQRTLNFAGFYGPYTGTGASLATIGVDYPVSLGALTYMSRPFAAVINGPTSNASNVIFSSGSRQATDASLVNGPSTTYSYQWELLDSGNAVIFSSPPGTGVLAAIPNFVVPKTTFTGKLNTKARLTLSTALANLSAGCASLASHSITTTPLSAPDPKITVSSGCQYTSAACTMTVTSPSGQDVNAWTIVWSVSGGSAVSGGTGKTFSPSFIDAGNYTVSVDATNPIGGGADSHPTPIAVPPCNGKPTDANISVGYAGATSGCNNTPCKSGERIDFRAYPFGYVFNATCDQYLWTFGDGATASTLQASHTYSGTGPYTGSFKITNGSNTATLPFTVTFGSSGGGGCQVNCGPPACGQLVTGNLFITYTGASGCDTYHTQACNTGENIAFVANAYNGYNFNCATHSFTWNFGDGQGGNGISTTHSYSSPGPYTVILTVSANGNSAQVSQAVTVGGTTPTCTAPTSSNVFISLSAGSGCTQSNPNCTSTDNIHFDVQGVNGYNFSACEHSYAWNFGDGGSSTSKSPFHTFSTAQQQYPVSVTVTNPQGNVTLNLNVKIAAVIGLCPAPTTTNMFVTYSGASGCSQVAGKSCSGSDLINFGVDFYLYNPTCGEHSYEWSFDDGTPNVKTKTTQHSFAPRSTPYDVKCTVNNGSGTIVLHAPVTVQGGDTGGQLDPKIDFAAEAVAGVTNLMKFTPTADPAGQVTTWNWNFGDGNTATATGTSPQQQFHQYAAAGTYTVTLGTSSASKTFAPVIKQVIVGTLPAPKHRGAHH